MNIQQIIINIFESSIFTSFLSFLLGIALGISIYRFYLYIKKLQTKYEYSDELREIIHNYILNGEMKTKEFGRLFHQMCQMANYLGIYRQDVHRMMRELQENGKLDFLDAEIKEKENDLPKDFNKDFFYQTPYNSLSDDSKDNQIIIKEKKNK
ncbi:hypothetical protein [Columbia Basin potato purple top phytoplasma]|uniref:Uncharacterized protein n=1 Tax=Columbia Basin potato purple top phytoplasma TaxID=307134 RepID=A0ABT5LB54_9MOLU|nr:hypothetical protein [Columbia Basin potato purple top phytoplasma]MDC9032281.1 hypothetical protein [Columbia Basin potato purple top phytoplasma]